VTAVVAAGGRYVEALASELAAIVDQSEIRASGPVRPRAREPLHARAGGLGQSKPQKLRPAAGTGLQYFLATPLL